MICVLEDGSQRVLTNQRPFVVVFALQWTTAIQLIEEKKYGVEMAFVCIVTTLIIIFSSNLFINLPTYVL